MSHHSWYDDECRETRARLKHEVRTGKTYERIAHKIFQSLTRRKKRAHYARTEDELYHTSLGPDCKEAWRRFRERRPPTPITSRDTWYSFTQALYDIPNQPPLPHPPQPRPHASTFFTAIMVAKAIKRLQNGRSQDHDGLIAEHISHARYPCTSIGPHVQSCVV